MLLSDHPLDDDLSNPLNQYHWNNSQMVDLSSIFNFLTLLLKFDSSILHFVECLLIFILHYFLRALVFPCYNVL